MASMVLRVSRQTARLLVITGVGLSVVACGLTDEWFGSGEGPPLPGERRPALQREAGLSVESNSPVSLAPATQNASWPVVNRVPSQDAGNLSFSAPFERVWSSSIGTGSYSASRLLTAPIIAGGRLYVTDADGDLTALDANSGNQIWRVRVAAPEEDSVAIGGGVAAGDRLLYVTTGFGEVLAVDPANGGLVWRSEVGSPIRSAPMVVDGRVYAANVQNEGFALDAATGRELWRHTGLLESAGLLGGASPSVTTGAVLVPYSSGEVYALRPESGRVLWSDSLVSLTRTEGLASLSDIGAAPVVDGDLAFVGSNGGRFVALDVRTGARAWEREIGTVHAAAVSGNTVFVVSLDQQVVALDRTSGAVRWIYQLPRYRNPEDRIGPIVWAGPVLAGGDLVLASSEGQLIAIDAASGQPAGAADLPDGTAVAPIVANGTLYVLTDDGRVTAYR
jgi:outer membrane protein assembly factor BamB